MVVKTASELIWPLTALGGVDSDGSGSGGARRCGPGAGLLAVPLELDADVGVLVVGLVSCMSTCRASLEPVAAGRCWAEQVLAAERQRRERRQAGRLGPASDRTPRRGRRHDRNLSAGAPTRIGRRWKPPTLGRAVLALAAVLSILLTTGGPAHSDSQWSGTLTQAVDHVPVASEVRTGYDRGLFPHWIDADRDRCHTRNEVLIAEATTKPKVGSTCTLSGGRWYSYYDNR